MWLPDDLLMGDGIAQHGRLEMLQWGHYTKELIFFRVEESQLKGLDNAVIQDPEL